MRPRVVMKKKTVYIKEEWFILMVSQTLNYSRYKQVTVASSKSIITSVPEKPKADMGHCLMAGD